MEDITIVSAFFDIGRGEYSDFQRSSEKYINWFKRWARIKNKLVVYLQDEIIIDKVKKIREEYGLLDQTIVVKVDDVNKIEPNILRKWEAVETNQEFIDYRDLKKNPENKAKYNYINLIKSYFMKDVAEKYASNGYVVWIDFGFEHGGEVYEDENDYGFLWKYDFGDKINLFYINEITNTPIFKMVKTLGPDCILGSLLVTPASLAESFWKANLESANILADVGLMDDDQLIYLMSYRRYPELFKVNKSDWFMAIHDCGGSHFKVKEKEVVKYPFLRKVKNKIKSIVYGK